MIINKYISSIKLKLNNDIFKNSFWGVLANIIQNLLFSLFFIVIARKYNIVEFSSYILANSLYAFIVAFSTLGLGQWFVREIINTTDKITLVAQFFKLQILTGIFFYSINIFLVFFIYDNLLVRNLSLLIGINIIFDNIIYVISYNNIANQEQQKNFKVLTIEAILKFIAACVLFIISIPIIYLSFILIFLRFISLLIFIKMGISNVKSVAYILNTKINWETYKNIIIKNWMFILIGSISVIYWRVGIFLVSKNLPFNYVANYEISYKLFSIALVIPFIISTSIYPKFIQLFQVGIAEMKQLYSKIFLFYAIFGFFVYTLVYSFSDKLIPILFGIKYFTTAEYCSEMFLTILLFPTVLLQANLLISMKLERIDMQLNFISLFVNILFCTVGLYFYKSLSIVNYSIFFSFLIFHISQDIILYRLKILPMYHILLFYVLSTLFIFSFIFSSNFVNKQVLFFTIWISIVVGYIIYNVINHSKKRILISILEEIN